MTSDPDVEEFAIIKAAIERADKGDFVSHAKVAAWLKSWGTTNELPPPEPDIFMEKRR